MVERKKLLRVRLGLGSHDKREPRRSRHVDGLYRSNSGTQVHFHPPPFWHRDHWRNRGAVILSVCDSGLFEIEIEENLPVVKGIIASFGGDLPTHLQVKAGSVFLSFKEKWFLWSRQTALSWASKHFCLNRFRATAQHYEPWLSNLSRGHLARERPGLGSRRSWMSTIACAIRSAAFSRKPQGCSEA